MRKNTDDSATEAREEEGYTWDVQAAATRVLTFPFRALRIPLLSNAFYLMLNTVAGAVIGATFWFVAARYYPSAEVGLAAAVIPLATFLAGAATMGLGIGLIRFLPETLDEPSVARRIMNTSLTVAGGLGIVFALVFLAGVEWWAPRLAFLWENPFFAVGFVILPAVLALRSIHMHLFVAFRKVQYAFASSVIGGLRIPLAILFLGVGGSLGIVASFGIGILLAVFASALVFLPLLLPRYRPLPSTRLDLLRPMAGFSLGNHAATLIASLLPAALAIMVLEMRSPEENAWFYIAWFMGSMLYTVSGSLSTSLFAEGSQGEVNLARDIRWTVIGSGVLLTLAGAVLWFAGDYLLGLFGSEYATGGFRLLRWIVLAAPFVLVNQVYFTLVRIAKRVLPLVLGVSFIAALTFSVSFVFLPEAGLVAIGVGYLLAQGIFSVASVFGILRRRGVQV